MMSVPPVVLMASLTLSHSLDDGIHETANKPSSKKRSHAELDEHALDLVMTSLGHAVQQDTPGHVPEVLPRAATPSSNKRSFAELDEHALDLVGHAVQQDTPGHVLEVLSGAATPSSDIRSFPGLEYALNLFMLPPGGHAVQQDTAEIRTQGAAAASVVTGLEEAATRRPQRLMQLLRFSPRMQAYAKGVASSSTAAAVVASVVVANSVVANAVVASAVVADEVVAVVADTVVSVVADAVVADAVVADAVVADAVVADAVAAQALADREEVRAKCELVLSTPTGTLGVLAAFIADAATRGTGEVVSAMLVAIDLVFFSG